MSQTGVCGQFGFAAESTVGTGVTVDHFVPVRSYTPELDKQLAISEGVRACASTPFADEVVVVGRAVTGQMVAELRSKKFGPLFKQILGATTGPTQVGVTPIYRQIHTPGDLTGKSLTLQGGFPESYSANVRPLTHRGAKITQATIACQKGALALLTLDVDAWDESTATALATAGYPTGWEIFSWTGFTARIGGTPTTAAGRTTVAGGTVIKGFRGVSLAFALGLAVDRMQAGGAGIKDEQLENAMRQYTGSLDTEFADRTALYDVFNSNASTVLQFEWTGVVDLGSGSFPALRITYPMAKLLTGTPKLGGPDVVEGPVTFRAFNDPAGVHPACQIEYESPDTTL